MNEILLYEAILKKAKDDYIKARNNSKSTKEIEEFFKSDFGQYLIPLKWSDIKKALDKAADEKLKRKENR